MLTHRQRAALLYIQSFQAERGGVSPTLREIALAVSGSRNVSVGKSLVAGLEARGFIRRLPGRVRAIEVLRPIEQQVYRFNTSTKRLEPWNRHAKSPVGSGLF